MSKKLLYLVTIAISTVIILTTGQVLASATSASSAQSTAESHSVAQQARQNAGTYVPSDTGPGWVQTTIKGSLNIPEDTFSCTSKNVDVYDQITGDYWTGYYTANAPLAIPQESSGSPLTNLLLCKDDTNGYWYLKAGDGTYLGAAQYGSNYYLSKGGSSLTSNEEFTPICTNAAGPEGAVLDYRLPYTYSFVYNYFSIAVINNGSYASQYLISDAVNGGPDTLC